MSNEDPSLLDAAKAVLESWVKSGDVSAIDFQRLEVAVEKASHAKVDDDDDEVEGWCGHCACQSCYDAKRKADHW